MITAFSENSTSSAPQDTVYSFRTHRLPEDLPMIP